MNISILINVSLLIGESKKRYKLMTEKYITSKKNLCIDNLNGKDNLVKRSNFS